MPRVFIEEYVRTYRLIQVDLPDDGQPMQQALTSAPDSSFSIYRAPGSKRACTAGRQFPTWLRILGMAPGGGPDYNEIILEGPMMGTQFRPVSYLNPDFPEGPDYRPGPDHSLEDSKLDQP